MGGESEKTYSTLSKLVTLGYHEQPERFVSYVEIRASDNVVSGLISEVFDILGYLVTTPNGNVKHDLEGWKDGRSVIVKLARDTELQPIDLRLLEPRKGLDANETVLIFGCNVSVADDVDWEDFRSYRLIETRELYELVSGALAQLDCDSAGANANRGGPTGTLPTEQREKTGQIHNARMFRVTEPRLKFLYTLTDTTDGFPTWRSEFVEDKPLHHAAKIFLHVRRDTELLAESLPNLNLSAFDPDAVTVDALYDAAIEIGTVGRQLTAIRLLETRLQKIFGEYLNLDAIRPPQSETIGQAKSWDQYQEWLSQWAEYVWIWEILQDPLPQETAIALTRFPEVSNSVARLLAKDGITTAEELAANAGEDRFTFDGLSSEAVDTLVRHVRALSQADSRIDLPDSLLEECAPTPESDNDPQESLAIAERFVIRAGREADALREIATTSFAETDGDSDLGPEFYAQCLWFCQTNPEIAAEEDPLEAIATAFTELATVLTRRQDAVDRADTRTLEAVGEPQPIDFDPLINASSGEVALDRLTTYLEEQEVYTAVLESHIAFVTSRDLLPTLKSSIAKLPGSSSERLAAAVSDLENSLVNPVENAEQWHPDRRPDNAVIAASLELLNDVAEIIEAHPVLAVNPYIVPVTNFCEVVCDGQPSETKYRGIKVFVRQVSASGDEFEQLVEIAVDGTELPSTFPADVRDHCLRVGLVSISQWNDDTVETIVDAVDQLAAVSRDWEATKPSVASTIEIQPASLPDVSVTPIFDSESLDDLQATVKETTQTVRNLTEGYSAGVETLDTAKALSDELIDRTDGAQHLVSGVRTARKTLREMMQATPDPAEPLISLEPVVAEYVDAVARVRDLICNYPKILSQDFCDTVAAMGEEFRTDESPMPEVEGLANDIVRIEAIAGSLEEIETTPFDVGPVATEFGSDVRVRCLSICQSTTAPPETLDGAALAAAVKQLSRASREWGDAVQRITQRVDVEIATPDESPSAVIQRTDSIEKMTAAVSRLAGTYDELVQAYTSLIRQVTKATTLADRLRRAENADTERLANGVDAAMTQINYGSRGQSDRAGRVSHSAATLKRYLDLVEVAEWLVTEHPEMASVAVSELIEDVGTKLESGDRILKEPTVILDAVRTIATYVDRAGKTHPTVQYHDWQQTVEAALRSRDATEVTEIANRIDRLGDQPWEQADLFAIEWEEFEQLVAHLYQTEGFTATATKAARDMGVDVWATKDGRRLAIQVKQYAPGTTVGRPELQKLLSHLQTGDVDRVVLVTSSSFAKTAQEYARTVGPDLELVNGRELVARLSTANIPPP